MAAGLSLCSSRSGSGRGANLIRLATSSLEEMEEEEGDSRPGDGWMRILACLERAIEGC